MIDKALRALLAAAALTLVAGLPMDGAAPARADGQIFPHPQYDLFYNYYVRPSPRAGGVGADLYVAPVESPPHVGHTYYTYQPLMPHEFMYPHCRTYRRYDHRFGVIPRNTTRVIWW